MNWCFKHPDPFWDYCKYNGRKVMRKEEALKAFEGLLKRDERRKQSVLTIRQIAHWFFYVSQHSHSVTSLALYNIFHLLSFVIPFSFLLLFTTSNPPFSSRSFSNLNKKDKWTYWQWLPSVLRSSAESLVPDETQAKWKLAPNVALSSAPCRLYGCWCTVWKL